MTTSARLLLLTGIVAAGAFATPIDYNINFTATTGVAPTGSFTYDSTIQQFSNFAVVWDGLTYSFPNPVSEEAFDGTQCGTTPSAASVFALLTGSACSPGPNDLEYALIIVSTSLGVVPPEVVSSFFQLGDFESLNPDLQDELAVIDSPDNTNTFTVTAAQLDNGAATTGFFTATQATPEPSTFILTLACGAFLVRKRTAVTVRRQVTDAGSAR